jgi:hypothetical protein
VQDVTIQIVLPARLTIDRAKAAAMALDPAAIPPALYSGFGPGGVDDPRNEAHAALLELDPNNRKVASPLTPVQDAARRWSSTACAADRSLQPADGQSFRKLPAVDPVRAPPGIPLGDASQIRALPAAGVDDGRVRAAERSRTRCNLACCSWRDRASFIVLLYERPFIR